jgi:hypothetical protein
MDHRLEIFVPSMEELLLLHKVALSIMLVPVHPFDFFSAASDGRCRNRSLRLDKRAHHSCTISLVSCMYNFEAAPFAWFPCSAAWTIGLEWIGAFFILRNSEAANTMYKAEVKVRCRRHAEAKCLVCGKHSQGVHTRELFSRL